MWTCCTDLSFCAFFIAAAVHGCKRSLLTTGMVTVAFAVAAKANYNDSSSSEIVVGDQREHATLICWTVSSMYHACAVQVWTKVVCGKWYWESKTFMVLQWTSQRHRGKNGSCQRWQRCKLSVLCLFCWTLSGSGWFALQMWKSRECETQFIEDK